MTLKSEVNYLNQLKCCTRIHVVGIFYASFRLILSSTLSKIEKYFWDHIVFGVINCFRFCFLLFSEQETRALRVHDVHTLVHRLPQQNRDMLDIIIKHLQK